MPIIAHKQIKKTGLSEAYLEVKNRIDQLEEENLALETENILLKENLETSGVLVKAQDKEIKKLKAALNKLEKENEKLRNELDKELHVGFSIEGQAYDLSEENKKLKAENEKLKNPRIWKNDGEL